MTDDICIDSETPIAKVFEFAISKEVEGLNFYLKAAERSNDPGASEMFRELSDDEKEHKATLQSRYRDSGFCGDAPEGDPDIGVQSEMIMDDFDPNMTVQEAIQMAIKKEKAGIDLYQYSEERFDGELKEVFKAMKEDEMRHLAKLQDEYDRAVSWDN